MVVSGCLFKQALCNLPIVMIGAIATKYVHLWRRRFLRMERWNQKLRVQQQKKLKYLCVSKLQPRQSRLAQLFLYVEKYNKKTFKSLCRSFNTFCINTPSQALEVLQTLKNSQKPVFSFCRRAAAPPPPPIILLFHFRLRRSIFGSNHSRPLSSNRICKILRKQ